MKAIDSRKVAEKTYKCGKKLKLWQTTQGFVKVWEDLSKDNPTMLKVKELIGDDLFNEVFQTIITFYALNLLAYTHNQKEFDKIINDCEVEDGGEA